MPSLEGVEIRQALERGYDPSELHVADFNRAVVATLTKRFRGIQTYGVTVARAASRISGLGIRLQAISLDYCGRVSPSLLNELAGIAAEPCARLAMLFVNFLRGREEPYLTRIIADSCIPEVHKEMCQNREDYWDGELDPNQLDVARIIAVSRAADRVWCKARAYKSTNGQSFLTAALGLEALSDEAEAAPTPGPPGAPLPATGPGETWTQYRRRLSVDQSVRAAWIAAMMGITEPSLMRYISSAGRCEA